VPGASAGLGSGLESEGAVTIAVTVIVAVLAVGALLWGAFRVTREEPLSPRAWPANRVRRP
jgi:hypothetical protein